MKKHISLLASILFGLSLLPAGAQLGQPGGSAAENVMTRVFGTNLNFSADMSIAVKMPAQNSDLTMTGKIYFAHGNSRTEMDMTKLTGSKLPAHAADQMKAMGMDQLISISRSEANALYLIYPGLNAYAQLTVAKPADAADSKPKPVVLGKETLDGHPCVKNQYTVTNAETGGNLVMTTWNATDLKDYPIKIEINSPEGTAGKKSPTFTTLHFTDLNTTPPVASLFEPPVGFRVYPDLQAMMQTEMMRKAGVGTGLPPNHPAPPAGNP